ncbi:MAG: hypothetical protein AAF380_00015 [Bacteroidota bacterium]
MAITRLNKKQRRNIAKAKQRKTRLKLLLATPLIKHSKSPKSPDKQSSL